MKTIRNRVNDGVLRATTRRRVFALGAAALPLAALMVGAVAAPAAKRPAKKATPAAATKPDPFAADIKPVIDKYCVACHTGPSASAGVNLARDRSGDAVLKNRKLWESVARTVEAGHMPPQGMPQPTQEQRDLVVAWLDAAITQADCALDDPGRVTMRRLNREEYNNTVRDLVGVNLRPADEFPSDDVGYGFDNIGDVLSISPLHMEKYLAAADRISRAAIVTPEGTNKPARLEASRLDGGADFTETQSRELGTEQGEIIAEHTFPQDGEYLIKVGAWAQQAGPDVARMAARFDGAEVARVEVKATQKTPEVYPFRVTTQAGKRRFAVSFLNNYKDLENADPKLRGDRNLFVDFVEIVGPLGVEKGALPASHRRILYKRPATKAQEVDVARDILKRFASRAYRRPATDAEVTRLLRYVRMARAEGESFERGVQLAVQAVLVSPHFLFRVELDKEPANPKARHLVSSYEMASRLSYFLWSSMPDDALLALAAKNKLQDPKVLAAQVKRMLKDPKARALSENFAVQWLTLRNLANVNPDPDRFPTWNDKLRTAMRRESELFFADVVREDRSVLNLIDAKFTYLNGPLARHYGIDGVEGEQFRRVALGDGRRGGVLTQASVLTVTSNPTRTSPVKRGKWVLEQLLGTPPPPAPPGVPELEEQKGPIVATTVRQRLEEHRKNPACASCHQRMDPIGFGLENFDPTGAWRARDGEQAIDASGELTGGQKFNGPVELKKILLAKKTQFVRAFSTKLLTYALGRGIESYDKCHVDDVALATSKNGYRFSALVTAVVQSDPFRQRRGDMTPRSTKPNRQRAASARQP
jgi:hypothetical protein